MNKVNLSGGKALKLIVAMVCFCIVIGMLAANSLKILSIANYGNPKTVVVSGSGNSGNSGSSGNSGGNQGSNNNNSNNNSNNTSGGSSSGVGTTSGALPTTPDTTVQNGDGSGSNDGSSETQAPTQAPTQSTDTPTQAPTQAPTQTTTKPTEPATDSPEVKKEKALILGEYKTIVNASNALAHGFTKTQYRTLDKTNFTSIILKSRFESKCSDYLIPESSPKVTAVAAGNIKNMVDFCIPYEESACYADTSKASEMLKSAEKTTDEDGNITITLVLRDEVNPVVKDEETGKPASYTSSVLDIITTDDFAAMAKKASLFGTTDISMVYSECTIVLKYKPLTLTQKNEIISLKQTVNYTATVSDSLQDGWNSLLGSYVPISTGLTVTDVTEYTDFTTVIDTVVDKIS